MIPQFYAMAIFRSICIKSRSSAVSFLFLKFIEYPIAEAEIDVFEF
jgi:hypothetical protein